MDFGGSFLYRLLKDLLKWLKGRKGNLSPADRLVAREKWNVFEERLLSDVEMGFGLMS